MRVPGLQRTVLVALLACPMLTTRAQAQATRDQLAKCAAIFSNLLRLECYDALSKRKVDSATAIPPTGAIAAVPPPAPATPALAADTVRTRQPSAAVTTRSPTKADSALAAALGAGEGERIIGRWYMTVATDPITDRKDVTFILPADGADAIDTPALVFRCIRGNLEAVVSADTYMSDYNTQVTIRFGTDPPTKERWNMSSSNTALFYPGGRQRIEPFISKLAAYPRFVIEVQPYQKLPKAIVFTLDGVDQVSQELWKTCPAK